MSDALAVIAALTAQPEADVRAQARDLGAGAGRAATPDEVDQALRRLSSRVAVSPVLSSSERAAHQATLRALALDPPPLTAADLAAWRHLTRGLADVVPAVDRAPVQLPAMAAPQQEAWHTLLDLDERLPHPWVLVGGQMVVIHCLEHDLAMHRATDDGDVVLGVWTDRDAFAAATRLLRDLNFEPTPTSDGFDYRYRRGNAMLDLLLPEGLDRQRVQPPTLTGRPALSIEGGNQALIRAERLPVQVGDRTGHIRRPTLLGALVAKAAALGADRRDPDRHREDFAVLGHIAFRTGLRDLAVNATPNDRKRLRAALAAIPLDHPAWRVNPNPDQLVAALLRLVSPQG